MTESRQPNPFQQSSFISSAWEVADFVPDEGLEVAFAGRSNAGKSSAINVIAGQRQLARISKTPGRTQLINFFDVDADRRLVDLPGYGYAKVPEKMQRHWRVLMESYFATRRSLAGLFVIMDVRRPLTDYDTQMLDWAISRECPAHVLLTKADKLKRGKAASSLLGVRRDIGDAATVQLFSAQTRQGVDEARLELATMLGLAGG
ncbi:MAG: ribosome biogenesis GTP-binding protein YihA/YsxC [Gammaproteobacteria bacterium]|nr:ribosome biogenesis GTP-binding protein YihA/YsxC [Gammaproteobacteria bacterium]NNF59701.1 YihA family ribosome biogenesis GTP-binding protein [Gammaproteobacteria bacterium]